MTQLSPHFSLEEFTHSQTAARHGIKNDPPSEVRANLQRLAETLEKVRACLNDEQVIVSSGYRSPKLNAAVGGSKGSKHMKGLAVDFTCPDFGEPLTVCQELKDVMDGLAIDQLIHEYGTWVHLGLSEGKPRYQCLTIDKDGTRSGF